MVYFLSGWFLHPQQIISDCPPRAGFVVSMGENPKSRFTAQTTAPVVNGKSGYVQSKVTCKPKYESKAPAQPKPVATIEAKTFAEGEITMNTTKLKKFGIKNIVASAAIATTLSVAP